MADKTATIDTIHGPLVVDVLEEVEIPPFGTFYVTPCPMSFGPEETSITEPRTGLKISHAWDKDVALLKATEILNRKGLEAFNAQVAKKLAEVTSPEESQP